MYIRVVQATVKPKRLAEFKHAVKTHDLPVVRSLPGFLDQIELYSKNAFLGITFWQTSQDAEHYAHDVFPRIAARSEPLVCDTAVRAVAYDVAYDTLHQVEEIRKLKPVTAGALAAAA
ncbi:MAG: hypothetical protein ACE14M_04765 [Terriglobales bacterium]